MAQVHVAGKSKGGEKPNRAEIESILKAGGARLVDSAEAASADLAVVQPGLTRDHAEVCSLNKALQSCALLASRHWNASWHPISTV